MVISTLLVGCDSDIQWFRNSDGEKLTGIEDKKMEKDIYYAKQGSRFYETLSPNIGASKNKGITSSPDRVIPLYNCVNLVPSQYYGEGIAYTSTGNLKFEFALERFKDLGYSLGCYNGHFDENGYYTFKKSMNCVEDSSLGQFLEKKDGDDVRIAAINEQPVTVDMVDLDGGVICGLDEMATYSVQLFIGTQFYSVDIVADTLMLRSMELYEYEKEYLEFSSNGYLYFNTPTDLRSGYYWINGSGLFKYFDHKKGEGSDDVDMNENYYASEKERIEANSRQYTVNVGNRVKDMEILVPYTANDEVQESQIKGYVYAPDGTSYDMEVNVEEKVLRLMLTEASAGEWTVNVMPKDVNYGEVAANSTEEEEQPSVKEKAFIFETDAENIVFSTTVKSNDKDEVHGFVMSPDGRSYDMSLEYENYDKTTGKIYYEMPYLTAGEWQVKIYYHPTTTELGEITQDTNKETETEVIIVE